MPDPTMWAVTVKGGPRAIKVPKPVCTPGNALIRVQRVGICGTDLAMFHGYTDFEGIIGHEFSGIVEECESPDLLGKRVTASINIPENIDPQEFSWETAKHAPHRKAFGIRGFDGVMAEWAVLPESILYPIPDSLTYEEGALAEPLAAAIHAVETLFQHRLEKITPDIDKPVLLIGDGRLAQLIQRVLQSRTIVTHVYGLSVSKLEIMRNHGAVLIPNKSLTPNTYSFIIEASGSPEGIKTAIECCKPTGRIVVKSTFPGEAAIDLARVVVDEITIVGSRCGNIQTALNELHTNRIVTNEVVSAVYPLTEAEQAFQHAVREDAVKILLDPTSG